MRFSFLATLLGIILTTIIPTYGQRTISTQETIPNNVSQEIKIFFGMRPNIWFHARGPITPRLLAAAKLQPQSNIALLLTDSVVQKSNNRRFLLAYLLNTTNKAIKVDRSDETLGQLQVLYHLDGKWITPNFLPGIACGNSFWKDSLASKSYFSILIDDFDFHCGLIPVEYKLLITIGGSTMESSVLMAGLTEDKIYWLRHPSERIPTK